MSGIWKNCPCIQFLVCSQTCGAFVLENLYEVFLLTVKNFLCIQRCAFLAYN